MFANGEYVWERRSWLREEMQLWLRNEIMIVTVGEMVDKVEEIKVKRRE